MHALLVVAHPSPDSFSHALAHAAREALVEREFAVDWHDLYAEGFDPVQRTGEAGNTASADALVERHCAELARADLVVVCHPNWWGQPPAILKGWIDRVFRLGTAYVGVSRSLQFGPWGLPDFFRPFDGLEPVAVTADHTIAIYRTDDLRRVLGKPAPAPSAPPSRQP